MGFMARLSSAGDLGTVNKIGRARKEKKDVEGT